MKCHDMQDRLNDYIDGLLAEDEATEVEGHLRGCPQCQEEEEKIRSLIADARALPKRIEPSADLWHRIAERIAGQASGEGNGRVKGTPSFWKRRGRLAAAAVLLIAFCAGTAWIVLTSRPAPPAPMAARPAADTLPAAVVQIDIGEAEAEYLKALKNLLILLNERKCTLEPHTVETVNENIRIVDAAIRELKRAMVEDPGNHQLTTLLMAMYQREVDLLQQATQWSVKM